MRITAHGGQGFQSNVDADSSGTWTEFQRDRGHFVECAGIASTMPCRHGDRECGDDDGVKPERLNGRARDPRHHESQEDPWLREEEKTPSMLVLPAVV